MGNSVDIVLRLQAAMHSGGLDAVLAPNVAVAIAQATDRVGLLDLWESQGAPGLLLGDSMWQRNLLFQAYEWAGTSGTWVLAFDRDGWVTSWSEAR